MNITSDCDWMVVAPAIHYTVDYRKWLGQDGFKLNAAGNTYFYRRTTHSGLQKTKRQMKNAWWLSALVLIVKKNKEHEEIADQRSTRIPYPPPWLQKFKRPMWPWPLTWKCRDSPTVWPLCAFFSILSQFYVPFFVKKKKMNDFMCLL